MIEKKASIRYQMMIAAPSSNAGKTTVTLGLLRAFQRRGLRVQPFKSGPDYIDPKFHQIACGQPGINLDLMMMPQNHLENTYHEYTASADLSLTEGVMGLFDGAVRSKGSSAELAKKLNLPVILIVDAKAMAYTTAPLLYGYKNFDPQLRIAGVIFNRVNTKSHFQFLKEACEDVGVAAIGHLPYLEDCEIPSRHLGLSLDTIDSFSPTIDRIADTMEKTLKLDQLLETTEMPFSWKKRETLNHIPGTSKIAIAKDKAFNFTYGQNIKQLEQHGKISFFSPLQDHKIPEADLLYLPGGYPELYGETLAENNSMIESIRAFIASEGQVIAECGGMMYLGEKLIDQQGKAHHMVGALELTTSMIQSKLSLGYRNIRLGEGGIKGA